MNFYQRLRDIREDCDLKQSDIAKVLRTTSQQISKYETGQQMMGIDKYITLARYYNVSLDYLCGLSDERTQIMATSQKPPTKITILWSENRVLVEEERKQK